MIIYGLAVASMLCAITPAVLFVMNLRLYRAPSAFEPQALPRISGLIPARDEAHGIEAAVASVLASKGVEFEVVVMDDSSTDGTGAIVAAMAERDARVRLEEAPKLPAGWNGKQHACWSLAHVARHNVFCFMDADVRLEPEALARMAAFMEASGSSLVSGFPRQETETWMEWLLLPLIHFVLLGFLPMDRMRKSTDPAYAAGCGQFLMMTREAYFVAGGHAEIKATMHDGLLLPKLFRKHGMRTDLSDMTLLARCRMYRNAAQVWHGLAKNATEGIAAPARIVPISLLLVVGQIVPYLLLMALLMVRAVKLEVVAFVMIAVVAAWLPRVLAAIRFRQNWRGALLHPVGIAVLLAIQWYSLVRKLTGGAVSWKNRAYAE